MAAFRACTLGLLGVCSALGFASCGSRATSTTAATTVPATTAAAPNGAASYVGQATNAEVFIQWTRSGDTLTGSLQEAIRKEAGSTEVESSSTAFTGTIAGDGLALTLNQGLGSTKALVGQLHGAGFTMTFPGQEHALTNITFVSGTVADYNHAVREIEGRAEQGGESTSPGGFATHVESCGTIPDHGADLHVTTDNGVGCPEALGVFRDFLAGRGERHEGSNEATSYTAVDGWQCGSGAGGFGCNRSGTRIEASGSTG